MSSAYNTHLADGNTFDAADVELDKLKADLVSPSWIARSHGDVERQLTVRVREVVRHLLQAHVTLSPPYSPIEAEK